MQNFVIGIIVSLAVGNAVSLWRSKPGERLKASVHVTLAIVAISLACGVVALLGVKVTGIND
jgi:hypothetical protein